MDLFDKLNEYLDSKNNKSKDWMCYSYLFIKKCSIWFDNELTSNRVIVFRGNKQELEAFLNKELNIKESDYKICSKCFNRMR